MSGSPMDRGVLAERIRERIRGALVDVLPDDEWRGVIRQEITLFLHGERSETFGRTVVPGIRSIVQEEVAARVRTRVAEEVAAWPVDLRDALGKVIVETILADGPRLLRDAAVAAVGRAISNVLQPQMWELQNLLTRPR